MKLMIDLEILLKSWPIIAFILGAIVYQIRHNTQSDAKISQAETKIQAVQKDHEENKTTVWAKLDTMQSLMLQAVTGIAKLEGKWESKDSK